MGWIKKILLAFVVLAIVGVIFGDETKNNAPIVISQNQSINSDTDAMAGIAKTLTKSKTTEVLTNNEKINSLQSIEDNIGRIQKFGENINCSNSGNLQKTFIKTELVPNMEWFPSVNEGRISVWVNLENKGCTKISTDNHIDAVSFVVYNNTIVSSVTTPSIWGGKNHMPAFPNDYIMGSGISLKEYDFYFYTNNKEVYEIYVLIYMNNTLVGGNYISGQFKNVET